MWRLGSTPQLGASLLAVAILGSCTLSTTNKARQKRQQAFEAKLARFESGEEKGWRKRDRPVISTPQIEAFEALKRKVGARSVPVEAPCLNTPCTRRALGRLFNKLDRIEVEEQGIARILVLGDSHIAGDYIARAVRDQLQHRFGNAGRGFVAIDQKAQFGGRRLSKSHWYRRRIVDGDGPGKAFGFSGMRLEATKAQAKAVFSLKPYDDDVVAYFLAQPGGSVLSFFADGEQIGRASTQAKRTRSRVHRIAVPERVARADGGDSTFTIVAEGPKATIFGLSFESYEAGVILDAIGPVGADAGTYLQMEWGSLRQHLRALDPDVVMIMLGGNDALQVRKGKRTLREVVRHHRLLIRRLRRALPDADCLLWAPLDAGVRRNGRIESKDDLVKIRDLQRKIARKDRCAFWDTYQAMGGSGSFARWFKEDLMNKDLIHPRAKGGDLLGHLFARALMDAYLNGP